MQNNDTQNNDMSGGPPERLRRWTGFLLSWVAAAGGEHYARALAAVGLKPHHLGVLVLLTDGPVVQARLSERLGVFKPVMVTLVNELEAMGLVRRQPHASDRRAVEIHLLPAGEQRIADAEAVSRRAADEFFAPLSGPERETFHALLTRLADRT